MRQLLREPFVSALRDLEMACEDVGALQTHGELEEAARRRNLARIKFLDILEAYFQASPFEDEA